MTERQTDTQIDPLFLDRWSPRAFDQSDITESDLRTILDAARWAPSAFNYQPWRLLYAKRGDAHWDLFLALLIPFNQSWARDASALLFITSDSVSIGPNGPTPSYSHSFDAGAAWAQLALQAIRSGYHAHAMTGVDFDRARAELAIPESFRIEAAVAIGKRADVSVLPEGLQDKEVKSDRKPLDTIAFAGGFPA
ncbi:nitroreductase family protein [Alteraurantiacibacter aquimixticola]|uniref:Nitroreductase n=1 Tax=Alteraurantiacibacter aquimixticola TaxID=2489173 RepID=A0A4T3F1R4_9SPHN|nr:nitroreductase family protein [Alteraurantiacibacter aquimixticola]TIX51153.1 nitroreductase [Alteraurantiacibacter aquimixticola]